MENRIAFTKSKLPHGWMGNLTKFEITDGEHVFNSSEQYFMWMRIKPQYANLRGNIKRAKNGWGAKVYTKGVIAEYREKGIDILAHQLQGQEDYDLMKHVVCMKLTQHPELIQMLLDTGDIPIYEDVTKRCNPNSSAFYWGAAEVSREMEGVDSFWVGKNKLGEILMYWRYWFSRNGIYVPNSIISDAKETTK